MLDTRRWREEQEPLTARFAGSAQEGDGLGIAIGLDEVRTEDVEKKPVAFGEVRPTPVNRESDLPRSRSWQPHHHLRVNVDRAKEFIVECQSVKLPSRKEVGKLPDAPVTSAHIGLREWMLVSVGFERTVKLWRHNIRRLSDDLEDRLGRVEVAVCGQLGGDDPGKT